MGKILFNPLLAIAIFYSPLSLATDFALLINGGTSPKQNSIAFQSNLRGIFIALNKKEFDAANIHILNAGGPSEIAFDRNTFINTLINGSVYDLDGDGIEDIIDVAMPEAISNAFDKIAKKSKPGDRVFLYITGHGDSESGLSLWNKKYFSTKNLRHELAKLPDGVTTQTISDICYSGQFQVLTSKNVCFLTKTDAENLGWIHRFQTSFNTKLSRAIRTGNVLRPDHYKQEYFSLKTWQRKSNNTKELKIPLLDAFEDARQYDFHKNTTHMTSIDYLLEQNEIEINALAPQDNDRLNNSDKTSSSLEQPQNPRRQLYIKYLTEKAAALRKSIRGSQWEISQEILPLRQDYLILKEEYNSLHLENKQLKLELEMLPTEQRHKAIVLYSAANGINKLRNSLNHLVRKEKELRFVYGWEKTIVEMKKSIENYQRLIPSSDNHYRLMKRASTNLPKAIKEKIERVLKKPELLAIIEELRIDINEQEAMAGLAAKKYQKTLRELTFIRYASEEKFEEYESIRNCLELEI